MIDARVRALVLGSFPSRASLAKRQYYGHPQNQFWHLVGRIVAAPLHEMPYEERLETLLACRVGLWDVIGRCEREGSLDQSIRRAARNVFDDVLGVATGLERVCFNGMTAAALEPWFAGRGYATFVLPSSSPANTVAFATKLRTWRKALAPGVAIRRGASSHESRATSHGSRC